MMSEWLISDGKTPPVCGPKGPKMTDQTATPHQTTASAYSPLKYDPELFRPFVQGMDLSASQQDALLEAVWLVIVGVIDLGFGQHGSGPSDSNPLAVDSSSVLALVSTSKTSNAEDAKADIRPRARRTDS